MSWEMFLACHDGKKFNDDTYLRFSDNIIDIIDGTYVQFDNYAGWDDGLMELLTAIGIKHSAV